MTLKDRVRELASERGLSLPVLEAKLGLGNGTIVKWDKASPNSEKLTRVADFFNVSVDYLLGRNDSEDSQPTKSEKELRVLARHLEQIPEETRNRLVQNFSDTIDTYLDAMGIPKEDKH